MCWGDKALRRPLMKRALTEHGADFLGLQEVTSEWKEYFDEDLSDFDSVFVYRGENSLEAVPIYWRRGCASLLDSGHFWLSETPDRESFGWNGGCLRIAVWGIFRLADGSEFAMINTHLDYASYEARLGGIRLIRRFAEEKFKGKIPFVLTGDFNAPRGDAAITVAEGFMKDSRLVAENTTFAHTCTHGNVYGGVPNVTIDYVFVSRDISCSSFRVIEESNESGAQSDHLGALAEIIV